MLELQLLPQQHPNAHLYVSPARTTETDVEENTAVNTQSLYSQRLSNSNISTGSVNNVRRKKQFNDEHHSSIVDEPKRLEDRQNEPSPISLSTPVADLARSTGIPPTGGNKSDTDYVSRKAKRMSRLYADAHSIDQFEALEVDASLLDYLMRHGAISEDTSQQILLAKPADRKSKLLTSLGLPIHSDHMPCEPVHPSSPAFTTGFALLINALRHTGHHSLASQLDFGRRITPSPGVAVCETESHGERSLFEHRRRGQLSLWVQLEAIKVNPNVFQELTKKSGSNQNNNNISAVTNPVLGSTFKSSNSVLPSPVLDCVPSDHPTDNSKNVPVMHPTSTCAPSSVWINHESSTAPIPFEHPSVAIPSVLPTPVTRKRRHRAARWLFKLGCLFVHLKRRKSKRRTIPSHTATSQPVANSTMIPEFYSTEKKASSYSLKPANDDRQSRPTVSTQDSLRVAKLTVLDTKSSEFYRLLLDPDSPAHESLVKYFEQSCGVLVLDCGLSHPNSESGTTASARTLPSIVRLLIVATQTERIKRLWDASEENKTAQSNEQPVNPGSRIEKELTEALIAAGTLELLQIQDLRLSVRLDSHEVELAIDELSEFLE